MELLQPGDVSFPRDLPLEVVFHSDDDDGASGGVVLEVLLVNDCIVYDGREFGDGDGLLSDEVLRLGPEEQCRAVERCGLEILQDPDIRVEATDCGGNVGADSRRLMGTVEPGACDTPQF